MDDYYIRSENWGCRVSGNLEDLEKEIKYKRLQYPKDFIKIQVPKKIENISAIAVERLKKAGADEVIFRGEK